MWLILVINSLLIGIALCEERECASNICLNGGSCRVDDVTRRFACRCPPGFSGSLCQEACTLECANGVCVKGAFGKEQCQCTQGWSGALCEVSGSSLEGCTKTEDCGIGERCVENDHGLKICTGDPCDSRPCKNNATCMADNDSFRCLCPLGFAGRLCDADVNECELAPCQHGGTCINLEGSFECLCEMRFSGPRCENEGATCAANPCLNQGTCIDTQNGFYCICPHGFEGKTCQNEKSSSACKCQNPLHICTLVNGKPTCACPQGFTGANCTDVVRGCDSEPCHNGGRCQNIPGGFRCYCTPDFGGETCEIVMQCLVDGSPCLNGGRCIRGLSENHCECGGNVTGRHCEQILVASTSGPCDSKPCLNGGTCHVDGNFVTCECPKGFSGNSCVDQYMPSTCDPNPCENGGKCQLVGDPSEDGFLCNCAPSFEGSFCEHPVSEWESAVEEITESSPAVTTAMKKLTMGVTAPPATATPSSNSGISEASSCLSCVFSDKCVESTSGVLCICQPGYQGPQCDQRGEPCDSVTCPRSLLCRQLVAVDDVHTKCECPIGFSGPKCQRSTVGSFDENSLFIHQSPSVMIGSSSGPLPYKLSFSMKTTVPTVHIASGENIFGQRLFSISLNEGYLIVMIQGITHRKLIPYVINDGSWYTLRLEKIEQDVVISAVSEDGYQLLLQSLPRQTTFDVFATRLGKISDSEFFVGCAADFVVGDSGIDLATSSRGTGISHGCKHTDQCSKNPCLNGGSCMDLWTHSSCVCQPPFLPPLCMHSLPPSTFGHDNRTSFAEIQIPSDVSQNMRFITKIQMILRSNRPNGAILFLGENGDELATFTSVSVKEGHLFVRSRAGGKSVHELKSHKIVNDNKDHTIQVLRQRRQVRLDIDGQLDSEGTIPSRFDHPMFAEKLQLGSSRGVSKDAFTTDFDFKGSLQDIRINDKSVVLHQQPTFAVDVLGVVSKLENILEGSISDDVCGAVNQCVHGTCHNTFNDFECRCQNGFYGRMCERKDYCSSAPCPPNGECKNIGDGFICTSPVTLKRTSALTFRMSEPKETSSVVKFSIRTHSQDGHVVTVESKEAFIKLTLANGQLVIAGAAPIPIRKTIADGQWHSVELNGNILYVDSASYGLPPLAQLPPQISSGSVRFGSADTPSFEGCMKEVTVGDLPPLSFYRVDESGQTANVTYWSVEKRLKITTECLSSPQCGSASPCVRGECRDLWNAYTCVCPPGFEGSLCEVNVDECARMDCGRGYCVDGIDEARCLCDPGFTGESCDAEMDMCATIPCKNAAICTSLNGTFECECKEGWVGKTCEIQVQPQCTDKLCRNGGTCESKNSSGVWCTCQPGFVGSFCEERKNPCENRPCAHGYCKANAFGFECECEEGYAGKTCSEIIDKCTEMSCSSQGQCTPVWNATVCTCDKRWRGASCNQLVDECMTIPCDNDGTCESTENGFKCHCRKYYMGDRCEVLGSCLKNPCERGECLQLSHDSHSCSCPKGYEGSRCEIRVNYCKRNPCVNGGTCESLLGEHKCHCIAGFTGFNCETDIDECLLGYCSNGATCRDRVADYECDCDGTGFTGKNCTVDINECASSSSCINGVCTNTLGGYRCDCELGYIGRRCSVRDPCRPDAFNRTTHTCVHGKCANPGVKADHLGHETSTHECKCNRGYTGPQCSTLVSERKVLALSYILGPMAAVLTVLTILGCTLLAFVLRGKRALHGHYSPSHQERNGARMQMNSMIKLPPEERLI